VVDSDGDGITEVISIGPGLASVIRSDTGNLLRTEASYTNAQELDTSGIDLSLGYNFDTERAGTFRLGFNGSWTIDYDLITDAGVRIDGVGSRNAGNTVGRPLPEFKLNATIGWAYKGFGASAIVRHIDGYDDDVPQSALRGAFIGEHPEIDSFTTVDFQSTYQLPALSFQDEGAQLTFGIKNVFNEDPPFVNVDGAFDPFTHDPRRARTKVLALFFVRSFAHLSPI